jgi:N-acetylglucosaminyl-diphospho-decaprenol L-rhamnosyltransferase
MTGAHAAVDVTLPVTAIVVSHNSSSVLPSCIGALAEQLAPEQLLVVDNASTDGSDRVAGQYGAEVIVSPVNQGFGAGCNLGARRASRELLLFLNPDVCVTSVDRVGLQKLIERRPLGLVAPRELLADNAVSYEPGLRRSVPWPCNVAREALGPLVPREISSWLRPSHASPGRRSWLSGALLLCARTEFLKVGGFDERLFLYYEDQELSRRYVMHGLPLSVTDVVSGRHLRGGSSGADSGPRRVANGASAMSAIEFVGISHGPLAGRCAWGLYHGLRRCAAVLVKLAGRGPVAARSARKERELCSTQSAAVELLKEDTRHYPLVKALARPRWP